LCLSRVFDVVATFQHQYIKLCSRRESMTATLGLSISHVKNKKIRNVAAMPSHSGQKSKNL